jgi:hypothetical protein
MKNSLSTKFVSIVMAGLTLSACATGPKIAPDANGDAIGPGPGANVVYDVAPNLGRSTGYCDKLREVRYRVKNTAQEVVSDYVHTYDVTSVPCNENPRPVGFCFQELPPVTVPAYDRRGLHNGQFLAVSGPVVRPVRCGGSDPYNYAQYTFSPFGPPVYDNKQGGYVTVPQGTRMSTGGYGMRGSYGLRRW